MAAYEGVDLRKRIIKESNITRADSVVDLCCGVGTSTASWGIGVDASKQFLLVANLNVANIKDVVTGS